MCLFIYTVSACKHTHFQNVAECPIAQGLADSPGARLNLTLQRPKFLFDTAQSTSRTPEYYKATFDCPKRKAVRPVAELCPRCADQQNLAAVSESLEAPPAMVCNVAGSGSAGSEVALVTASSSVSDGGTSGTSTPRSFWKLTRPREYI
ncbi:hypothetical protein M406DRAFT_329427 [Cryphonectria parasitica EP155]|uniref:Uncharacterized protein n=1 Tax=Cryphonectria parasitica (strain ATCC 38755 / EP155) TaxID=660469 RepID=A0A9P4Y2P8_CRYP1|nr:uncharacterized protein M406DRAFT_329427 [Cryphonectria parasitica EP155]KAF3765526.1 hypothetical protein M406DRAFT_329427 [Cryphonectria parasitica EP155]